MGIQLHRLGWFCWPRNAMKRAFAIVMFVRPSVRLSVRRPGRITDRCQRSICFEIELILSLGLHCARAIHFQVSIYRLPIHIVISAYLMSQQIGVLVKVEFRCPNAVQRIAFSVGVGPGSWLDSGIWVGISVLSRNIKGLIPTLTVTLTLSQHQPKS